MKRVYLLTVVFVLLVSVGKFLLFPAHTDASYRLSRQPAAPAEHRGVSPAWAAPSSPPGPSPVDKLGPGEDDADAEGFPNEPQALPAIVVAQRVLAIPATLSGTIGELPVSEGSSVDAGQMLAQIDDREILADIERQEARIAAAESRAVAARVQVELAEYHRNLNRQLSQKKIAAKAAVVESELLAEAEAAKLAALQGDVAVAQRERTVLQQRLAKYRIVAPFSGRVTEILRYRDQYVGQGDVILWIESHQKQLKLHLPADLIEKCEGALDRLQVSVSVEEGQWEELKVHTLKRHYNPDGSRTVLLGLGPDSTLLTGQIVETKVSLRGEKS